MEYITNKIFLVDRIHETPTKAVLIVTGGGTEIFPLLLRRGCGSNTLLDGIIPYSADETINLLGGKPDKFVSEQTARSLAMVAYQKAVKLNKNNDPVVGIACTASLQGIPTEREDREHNIYVAMQTQDTTISLSLNIKKEDLPTLLIDFPMDARTTEETLIANILLNLLAEGCNLDYQYNFHWPFDKRPVRKEVKSTLLGLLLARKERAIAFNGWNKAFEPEAPAALFPGSFNPLHAGHIEMRHSIRGKINKFSRCDYEISMFNVDKPPLDFITLKDRLEQFGKYGERVWVTNAPTFREKSDLFPHTSFVVGYDTALRIMNPKYAGPIADVIDRFKLNGTYFFIFPRPTTDNTLTVEGAVDELKELRALPGEYVMDKREHAHVSSSDIRKGKDNG